MLRITLAQLNPTLGDIEGNTQQILACAQQAAAQGAEMVVFSQSALTGYHPAGLLGSAGFMARLQAALQQLLQASAALPGLHWVLGLPIASPSPDQPSSQPPDQPGALPQDGLLVLQGGQVLLRCAREQLDAQGDFDELRYLRPGQPGPRLLRLGQRQVGFLIGAEAYPGPHPGPQAGAQADGPLARLAQARPDLLIHIDARASRLGARAQRHAALAQAAQRCHAPLLSVNQVGGHDQQVYDGGSLALLPGAGVVFEAQRFATDQVPLLLTDAAQWRSAQGESLPAVPADGLPVLEFYRQQIVLGLRDYARRCGFRQVVVGSSGGLDSALTLALAAEALGPQQVVAITMPSSVSTPGSVDDSVALCRNLGIRLHQHPIAGLVEAYAQQFQASFGQPLAGLARENLQARIRGTVLMEYSNAHGHLLLNTGNKSEVATGYCTLYGDTNGGLGLLGDLYKTEAFELARHLNASAGRELVPQAIIDKPPSAELAPGQRDDDSLPPYPVLDRILQCWIEGEQLPPAEYAAARAFVAELEGSEAGRATLQRVRHLLAISEYKRHQAPPCLRLRQRGFGPGGWYLPLAAKQG